MIPKHVFKPSIMGLPYAREIDKYMTKPGLIIQEHDVELGPITAERFDEYVKKQPDRIHAAPYLIRIGDGAFKKAQLCWVHRALVSKRADSLPKKEIQKMVQYLPGHPRPQKIYLAVATVVQGGEAESDYYGLGYTYIPKPIWDKAVMRVAEVDWMMLDTRLSEQTLLQGQRAILHWDCVASHSHVLS